MTNECLISGGKDGDASETKQSEFGQEETIVSIIKHVRTEDFVRSLMDQLVVENSPASLISIMRTGIRLITVRRMKMLVALVTALLILGCSASNAPQSQLENEIAAHLKLTSYKSIDFKEIGGSQWSRVCFFGPYSGGSSEVLGFPWRIEEKTDALVSDGHNAIVFATDKEVVSFVVISRGDADFWKLSRQCFQRSDSQFVNDHGSGTWNNYVRPNKPKVLESKSF